MVHGIFTISSWNNRVGECRTRLIATNNTQLPFVYRANCPSRLSGSIKIPTYTSLFLEKMNKNFKQVQ